MHIKAEYDASTICLMLGVSMREWLLVDATIQILHK